MGAGQWLAVVAFCCAGGASAAPPPDSSPLLTWGGAKRWRHLVAGGGPGGAQAVLEVLPGGEVRGAELRSPFSLLEIQAVKPGVVRIRGAQSGRFLCLDAGGRPRGEAFYSPSFCNFHERVYPDGYNVYEAERLHLPLALIPPGGGTLRRPPPPFTHFLPLPGEGPPEKPPHTPQPPPNLDPDSSDPLGLLGRPPLRSPSYGL